MARNGRDAEGLVVREAKPLQKLARPRSYKVLLHNDDYTTKEFVVEILERLFDRSEVEATAIMLHVHNHGLGVAGIYPFEIAETKVSEVTREAEAAEFPLLCTMEPDELGEGGEP
jgi:ATP-dependent Clp protease adaptor protein ClpS